MEFRYINSLNTLLKHAAAPSIDKLQNMWVGNKKIFTDPQFNALLFADPTYDGGERPGKYTPWLIKIFKNAPYLIAEDGYKANQYLEAFEIAKRRLTGPEKDIYSYKDLPELFEVVQPYIEKTVEESDSQLRRRVQKAKNDIEVLYEDEDWKVLIPESYEASCYWGINTEWCTATRSQRNSYDSYTKEGSLVIFINKHDPDEKYQYHYGSKSFMDANDSEVDLMEFMEDQENKDFQSFLLSLDEQMADEHFEKVSVLSSDAILDAFYDDYPVELSEFADNAGTIPAYIIDYAWENIWEYSDYEYQPRQGVYAWINWDGLRDELNKELPDLQAKAKEQQLQEEGQLTLPFEE